MRWVPVESTSLDCVGYENEVLEIRFNNGGVYRYSGVPEEVHEGLMRADSKGRFFNAEIRGTDRFTCLRRVGFGLPYRPPRPRVPAKR